MIQGQNALELLSLAPGNGFNKMNETISSSLVWNDDDIICYELLKLNALNILCLVFTNNGYVHDNTFESAKSKFTKMTFY